MSRVSVADTYSLKSHHPYIMMKTPYTDGNARKVIIDIWVQSMHQDNFRVDINPEGTEVSVSMRIPDIFYDPARLGREMTLVGARDAIQNAFDEAVDKVMSDHGKLAILPSHVNASLSFTRHDTTFVVSTPSPQAHLASSFDWGLCPRALLPLHNILQHQPLHWDHLNSASLPALQKGGE
jgi:hypothetical protein